MTKLKVTEEQVEEVSVADVVEAGQVRASHDGAVVLIVNGTKHECLMESEYAKDGDDFLIIYLKTDISEYMYATDNIRGMSSEEYVLEVYPNLLDAEMTYKEAK